MSSGGIKAAFDGLLMDAYMRGYDARAKEDNAYDPLGARRCFAMEDEMLHLLIASGPERPVEQTAKDEDQSNVE